MTALWRWAIDHAAAGEALNGYYARAVAASESWTAIVLGYSPDDLWFGTLASDGSLHAPGREANPELWYEARAFDGASELRWIQRTPDGSGRAVVIAESEAVAQPAAEEVADGDCSKLPYGVSNGTTYLLWGTGTGGSPETGWSTMASARIGRYNVPLSGVPVGASVQLEAMEYFARGIDGNAYLLDERLVGLRVQESDSKEAPDEQ